VLSCDLSLIIIGPTYFRLPPVFRHSYFTKFVAIYLRCGGILKYDCVANVPVSLSVKGCWKSVNIWGSYGKEFNVLFFDSRCSPMEDKAQNLHVTYYTPFFKTPSNYFSNNSVKNEMILIFLVHKILGKFEVSSFFVHLNCKMKPPYVEHLSHFFINKALCIFL